MRSGLLVVLLVCIAGCNPGPRVDPPQLTVKTLMPSMLGDAYAALQVLVRFEDRPALVLACDVHMETPRTGGAHCFWLEP